MANRFLCSVCDLVEEKCLCQKYCYFCMGENDVRLVEDGFYYCQGCRECCDYVPEDKERSEKR
jgi:hypothetical protein